jgi:AcrR family transcriptional regulator
MTIGSSPATERGVTARQQIVDSALALFEERGYEKTTMRAIAEKAGVSLGNAYYYFSSKDSLIQGFYERLQDQHRVEASSALAALKGKAARNPTARLLAVEHAFLTIAAPYHEFGAKFFAVASNPKSSLSPFSPDSSSAREAATALYADTFTGSDLVVDATLKPRLAELAWLTHMGITLRWVHDQSPGQRDTKAFVDRAVPLAVRLLRLTRFRATRPIIREALALLDGHPLAASPDDKA